MKVYDGAAMIAERSGAMIVPVRIEGLEATIFSRLTRTQVRRRWFPRVRVTVLEPVRLAVDDALKGRARRQAAGAVLYQIMSDLIFRTTPTDRTVVEAVVDAAKAQGWRRSRSKIRLPASSATGSSWSAPASSPQVLAASGQGRGVADAANAMAPPRPCSHDFGGARSGDDQFHRGRHQHPRRLHRRRSRDDRHSRGFVEKARLDKLIARSPRRFASSISRMCAAPFDGDKIRALFGYRRALVRRNADDRAAILYTSGSEGTPKGVVLSHRNMLCNAAQAAARIDLAHRQGLQHTADIPFLRAHRRLVLPLVSGFRSFSTLAVALPRRPELVYGANATILFGTDTFLSGYGRAAHLMIFARAYMLAGAEPVKEATGGYGRKNSVCAFSRATASPKPHRHSRSTRQCSTASARSGGCCPVSKHGSIRSRHREGGRLYVRGPNVMLGYLKPIGRAFCSRPKKAGTTPATS